MRFTDDGDQEAVGSDHSAPEIHVRFEVVDAQAYVPGWIRDDPVDAGSRVKQIARVAFAPCDDRPLSCGVHLGGCDCALVVVDAEVLGAGFDLVGFE